MNPYSSDIKDINLELDGTNHLDIAFYNAAVYGVLIAITFCFCIFYRPHVQENKIIEQLNQDIKALNVNKNI